MLLTILIILPLFGIVLILLSNSYDQTKDKRLLKSIALFITSIELFISLWIWILFNNSSKYFQFTESDNTIGYYDFNTGLDGLSLFFVLLTTIIIPISILSNWKSIKTKVIYFINIILLLETLLLLIYTLLDILMFYIFFESILGPLFILIGIFGSKDKQRASFYFFLYTFLGSLFMLLSIITISFLSGCTDLDMISKDGIIYISQLLLFIGIFIAFAVKTPVIYVNGWLLKAHVESPLSGSIILAAIVLKLSLYGIFRLILIVLPKGYIISTHIIFLIGVVTIIYASLSTIRTTDIKELIAYSSVSHAAVYFIGVFSNVIQGIIGSICLGLAHGFVSSGLFTIAGGVLYDRSTTRVIGCYKGLVQAMPIMSVLFFILCLGNCGAPLTLNFIGEFMSLYGVFERLPLAGIMGSSSIILSAAFTIYMFNRIVFGGPLIVKSSNEYISDLNIREYSMLLILVLFTIILGIYPSVIIDSLNYVSHGLIFNYTHEYDNPWGILFNDQYKIEQTFWQTIVNYVYTEYINILHITILILSITMSGFLLKSMNHKQLYFLILTLLILLVVSYLATYWGILLANTPENVGSLDNPDISNVESEESETSGSSNGCPHGCDHENTDYAGDRWLHRCTICETWGAMDKCNDCSCHFHRNCHFGGMSHTTTPSDSMTPPSNVPSETSSGEIFSTTTDESTSSSNINNSSLENQSINILENSNDDESFSSSNDNSSEVSSNSSSESNNNNTEGNQSTKRKRSDEEDDYSDQVPKRVRVK